MGLFPLGALTGGLLGEAVGARSTLLLAGAALATAAVIRYLALRGSRDVDALR